MTRSPIERWIAAAYPRKHHYTKPSVEVVRNALIRWSLMYGTSPVTDIQLMKDDMEEVRRVLYGSTWGGVDHSIRPITSDNAGSTYYMSKYGVNLLERS